MAVLLLSGLANAKKGIAHFLGVPFSLLLLHTGFTFGLVDGLFRKGRASRSMMKQSRRMHKKKPHECMCMATRQSSSIGLFALPLLVMGALHVIVTPLGEILFYSLGPTRLFGTVLAFDCWLHAYEKERESQKTTNSVVLKL